MIEAENKATRKAEQCGGGKHGKCAHERADRKTRGKSVRRNASLQLLQQRIADARVKELAHTVKF